MRYKVQVGKEFDLAEKAGDNFTIQVNVGANEAENGYSAWKLGLVGFLFFCALVVTPACAYGLATGDFSVLQSIAGHFNDLIASVVKVAISALEKK